MMLKVKAKIKITAENKNRAGGDRFCAAFNFGDDLLFSGRVGENGDRFLYNEEYETDVAFFTINEEAQNLVRPVLKKGMNMAIHEGKRILGIAKVLDFTWD